MEKSIESNAFRQYSRLGISEGLQIPRQLSPILEEEDSLHPNVPDTENVLQLFENVINHLSNKNFQSEVVTAIILLNTAMKILGEELEFSYPGRMAKFQIPMRDACKNRELDIVARLKLLEILELRSLQWKSNENITNYYSQKLVQLGKEEHLNVYDALEPILDLKYRVKKSVVATSTSFNNSADVILKKQATRPLLQASASPTNLYNNQGILPGDQKTAKILSYEANAFSMKGNYCMLEPSSPFKEIYIGRSITDLDNQAKSDATSTLNPLMMVEYTITHLCEVIKTADDTYYDPKECDEERAYTLYMKFMLVYKEIRKTEEYKKDLQNYKYVIGKDVKRSTDILNVIRSHLEKRYLEKRKTDLYLQANSMVETLTLEPLKENNKMDICAKSQHLLKIGNDVTDKGTYKKYGETSIYNKQYMLPKNSTGNSRTNKNDVSKCRQCNNYEYAINVGACGYIKLQGDNLEITKAAKLVLQNFINWGISKRIENSKAINRTESKTLNKQDNPTTQNRKIITYDRKTLLSIADSSISKQSSIVWTADWKRINTEIPTLLRQYVFPRDNQSHGLEVDVNIQNYVQSLFKSPQLSDITDSSISTAVKTIRARVETWDQAAEQWIEVSQ